ncbi:MAG TPA: sigma-70 family RNA polymerase sigma factor [Kofleriaceae bacterium]|nr:sigma-70 family RNA polymerase sigma factor [Kofleriaceae bacterium]
MRGAVANRNKIHRIESHSAPAKQRRRHREPELVDESLADLSDPQEAARAAAAAAADRMSDRRMPLYARAAAKNPVLDAVSERTLAREIAEGSAELWTVALADPATIRFAVGFATERIPAAARTLAAVEAAAEQARTARSASSRQALRRAADKASRRLCELDPDHEVIDRLVVELEDARQHPDSAPRALARSARTRAFAAHVERVESAYRAVSESRHRLAQANIGLVFHVAGKYPNRHMTLPDMVQEGMLGLLKAIDRFDHRRGFRFSTYATWWIRHHIGRALSDKSRLIRVPVHIQETHQRLNLLGRELRTSLGRDPTSAELAVAAETTEDQIELVRDAIRGNQISLDEPLGDDEDRTRHDLLPIQDPDADTAFDVIHRQGMARAARRQMEQRLSRVELDVIRKRFALDGVDREWTLQEIADTHGLSRERIRQIQDRALARLRNGLSEERIDAEAA